MCHHCPENLFSVNRVTRHLTSSCSKRIFICLQMHLIRSFKFDILVLYIIYDFRLKKNLLIFSSFTPHFPVMWICVWSISSASYKSLLSRKSQCLWANPALPDRHWTPPALSSCSELTTALGCHSWLPPFLWVPMHHILL